MSATDSSSAMDKLDEMRQLTRRILDVAIDIEADIRIFLATFFVKDENKREIYDGRRRDT